MYHKTYSFLSCLTLNVGEANGNSIGYLSFKKDDNCTNYKLIVKSIFEDITWLTV